jgi:serine/threonine protein kinase
MPHSDLLQFGRRLGDGRYMLLKPLGRGGTGEVWLARDERLDELVALKFLASKLRADLEALEELRRETSRSRRLTHPHIVRIFDLHENKSGLTFIAMEYVDGATLSGLRLLAPERVLKWESLKPWAGQLCAALDYAHAEEVIHRDLKPANLMVDDQNRLKLADFGIAVSPRDNSRSRKISGTLLYMSPQQLSGKPPEPTDDIYSLGATFYELLTSQPPFCTGDVTHQILHGAPDPLDTRSAALQIKNPIPHEVAMTILACLAKEPAQRPQTAGAVAERLGLQSQPAPSTDALAETLFTAASINAEEKSPGASGHFNLGKANQMLFERSSKKLAEAKQSRRKRVATMYSVLAALCAAGLLWLKFGPHYSEYYVDLQPAANSEIGLPVTSGNGSLLAFLGMGSPRGIFRAARGVTFKVGPAVLTQERVAPKNPVSIGFDISIPNPRAVCFLIGAEYLDGLEGIKVGEIELRFSEGTTLNYCLVGWETVRPTWQYRDSYKTIPKSSDPEMSLTEVYVCPRWRGRYAPDTLDMLAIRLPKNCWKKTLSTVRLIDTSTTTVYSLDPGLKLMGITVNSRRE